MTQLTDHGSSWSSPGRHGAATLRKGYRPSRSLALERLRRGLRRQILLVILLTLGFGALAAVYLMSGEMRPIAAAPLGLAIGFAIAAPLALIRELGRNTVTSLSSLGRHRNYTVMGAAPELTQRALRQLAPDQRTPLGCLAFDPASSFSTAFRDLQGALSEHRVVAFIGGNAGEGATTAALCAAASAAQQGRSVLLVDCDGRQRALTRTLTGGELEDGVLEACETPNDWQGFVREEEETGLHVLPIAKSRTQWKPLVSNPGFRPLLEQLREAYDLVVLDCPPALTNSEGAAIAGLADASVVVTAWDRTRLDNLRASLKSLKRLKASIAGLYVNRVPPGYRFGRLRGD